MNVVVTMVLPELAVGWPVSKESGAEGGDQAGTLLVGQTPHLKKYSIVEAVSDQLGIGSGRNRDQRFAEVDVSGGMVTGRNGARG